MRVSKLRYLLFSHWKNLYIQNSKSPPSPELSINPKLKDEYLRLEIHKIKGLILDALVVRK